VIKVTHTTDNMSVLVRAYGKGSELIIDRKQELIVSGQSFSELSDK
jgi:ethanolamine kinase